MSAKQEYLDKVWVANHRVDTEEEEERISKEDLKVLFRIMTEYDIANVRRHEPEENRFFKAEKLTVTFND